MMMDLCVAERNCSCNLITITRDDSSLEHVHLGVGCKLMCYKVLVNVRCANVYLQMFVCVVVDDDSDCVYW